MTTADQILTAFDADVDAGFLQWKRQQEAEARYWFDRLNDPDLADLDLAEFVDHGRDGVLARALVDGHTSPTEYAGMGSMIYKSPMPPNAHPDAVYVAPLPPNVLETANNPPHNFQSPAPKRAAEYTCLARGALVKHFRYPDGTGAWRYLNCNQCVRCLEWRVRLKAHQFAQWTGSHTMITAGGLADPDDVRAWISKQGRSTGGQRATMIRRNESYTWDGVIIYAQELAAVDRTAAEHRSRRAGATYRDWVGTLSIADFAALVPRERTVEGREGVSRRTLTFSHWLGLIAEDPDYLENDGVVSVNNVEKGPEPELPIWVVEQKALPIEWQAEQNARKWVDGCEALADYEGPQRLVKDARAWLDGDTPWREAYRPMLRLVAPDP